MLERQKTRKRITSFYGKAVWQIRGTSIKNRYFWGLPDDSRRAKQWQESCGRGSVPIWFYRCREYWLGLQDAVSKVANPEPPLNINVLADTTSRKWVPNLSVFFRNNLDFENFRVRFNYDNVIGDFLASLIVMYSLSMIYTSAYVLTKKGSSTRTGISRYKMNRNLNRKWSDVKKKRIKDNNQRGKE